MKIINKLRDEKYDSATDKQKWLCSSPSNGEKLKNIAKKHNLTAPDDYYKFVMLAGDTVLGMVTKEELPILLAERLELERGEAEAVSTSIVDFINQPDIPVKSPNIDNEIIETEKVLKQMQKISQLRTMAEDMQQNRSTTEQTYSTSQTDILPNKSG